MSAYLEYRDPGDETDWDASTETRYEEHLSRHSTGLCVVCDEDAALPDNDVCAYCLECIEGVEEEVA